MREVREIERDDAIPFLMKVHYARSVPQLMHCYGLFIDNILCGVVTYGIPASPTLCRGIAGDDEFYNVLELNRLVICDPTPNNASFLVGHSLRLLPRHRYVVSYADLEAWGHVGYIYQATNFLYTGLSASRTDVASNGKHSRTAFKKGEDHTQRQPRSRKHRYIYICSSSKKEKREMMAKLRYPILPYPKGETRRYDTTKPQSLMPELDRQQKKNVEIEGNLFFDNVLMRQA